MKQIASSNRTGNLRQPEPHGGRLAILPLGDEVKIGPEDSQHFLDHLRRVVSVEIPLPRCPLAILGSALEARAAAPDLHEEAVDLVQGRVMKAGCDAPGVALSIIGQEPHPLAWLRLLDEGIRNFVLAEELPAD